MTRTLKNVESNSSAALAEPAGEQRPHPPGEKIAARAYEIYQARGGTDGADLDDWLQAERELGE